jgi:hypothetical protein
VNKYVRNSREISTATIWRQHENDCCHNLMRELLTNCQTPNPKQEESSEWSTAMTIYWLHQLRTVSVGKSIKIRPKYSWQSIIQKSADVTHTCHDTSGKSPRTSSLVPRLWSSISKPPLQQCAMCVCARARLSLLCGGSALPLVAQVQNQCWLDFPFFSWCPAVFLFIYIYK